MYSIYVIVTHHDRPDEAAEAWKECGVCAIGFDLKAEKLGIDPRLFLEIEKGDLILAYAGGNRIALVGEVIGNRKNTTKNIVGKDEDDGGFGYPDQYPMNWFAEPYDFSRYDLPRFLHSQMGKRGRTVIKIDLERRSFDKVKQIILTNPESGVFSEKGKEDMIKAGILKYLQKNLDSLENGLQILKAEKRLSDTDQPDFIAKDARGNDVVIECKGTAYPSDCDQLERYGKNYSKANSRLMLVAFKIESDCVKRAKKNPRMELYECDLIFKRI